VGYFNDRVPKFPEIWACGVPNFPGLPISVTPVIAFGVVARSGRVNLNINTSCFTSVEISSSSHVYYRDQFMLRRLSWTVTRNAAFYRYTIKRQLLKEGEGVSMVKVAKV